MYFGVLAVIVSLAGVKASNQGVAINDLSQGIEVEQEGPLWSWDATWNVLVMVSEPHSREEMVNFTINLNQILDSKREVVGDTIYESWKRRISKMKKEAEARQENGKKRKRRGIFNFVGNIANTLFGVATEEQIQTVQHLLEKSEEGRNKIVHQVNSLLSLQNHTREVLIDAQIHLTRLHQRMAEFRTDMLEAMARTNREIQKLHIISLVQAFLEEMDSYLYQINRDWDLYYRRKRDLEWGKLTEDVLGLNNLKYIIEQGNAHGLLAADPNWYYTYTHMDPVWTNEGKTIVYNIKIPMTKDTSYLAYGIKTYPTPLTASRYALILAHPRVGINTQQGVILAPNKCLGINPAICRTGPLFMGGKYHCEKGLLNGNQQLREECKIQIIENNSSIISETIPGIYIVSNRGEDYSLSCKGEREKLGTIPRGVAKIKVAHQCQLTTREFTLKGILNAHVNITIPQTSVKIAPFSMDVNYNESKILDKKLEKLKSEKWIPLKHLNKIVLEPLEGLTIQTHHFLKSQSLGAAGVCAIIFIIIGVGGWQVYKQLRKRGVIKCLRAEPGTNTPTLRRNADNFDMTPARAQYTANNDQIRFQNWRESIRQQIQLEEAENDLPNPGAEVPWATNVNQPNVNHPNINIEALDQAVRSWSETD